MQKRHILAIALAMSMTFGMFAHAEESIVAETETMVEESLVVETETMVEESLVIETEAAAEESVVTETEAVTEESIVAETEGASEETVLEMPETEYVEELSDAKTYKGLEEFVARLYRICLSREPDEAGHKDWTRQLQNKEITGVQAAYGFVFSPEFVGRNLCNSDFVEQLYQAFMGRKSDAAGKADWVGKLSGGITREEVFNGFALSVEFGNLCNLYGIEQGTGISIPVRGTEANGKCAICGKTDDAQDDGVTGFVKRLYVVCLNRNADASGLADWTNRLRTHQITGRDAAYGFFFSQEFLNKRYDNSTYVEYLYKAMMGRASDQGGKNDWLNRLASGWTREMVFDGFAGSQEFTNICNSYGILRDSNMIPGILGTYESTFDIADKMVEEMDASMSSDGTNIGISFGDYMDEFKYVIISEFKQNGTYKQYVDMNVLRASYENMKAALKLYMEDAIFEVLKQSINAQDPWAYIRTKKDLENYFGMTFDQIIYEFLGMDLETYVDTQMDESFLNNIEAESKSEGKYKAQNGRLHMSASLYTNIDESVYETYVVNGNVVTITGGVNTEDLQNDYVSYPITMIKRAN